MNTVVLPTTGVQGDITSCKIENQVKEVHKQSPFSLTQRTDYITYDVCNKQVLGEYSIPQWTDMPFSLGMIVLVVGLVHPLWMRIRS